MSDKEKNENKSFSDSAKKFFNLLKDDFQKDNQEILNNAEKRRQETDELNQKMKELFNEIKDDWEGTAKDLYENLSKEYETFTEELKKGSATLADKLELEKRFDQLDDFLQKTGKSGAQQFKKVASSLKEKINKMSENMDKETNNTKNQAEEELQTKIDKQNEEIEKLKRLFDDSEDKES